MNTVYFDSGLSNAERRRKLYDGQLFVVSPTKSSLALCRFADQMIREAFEPLDPEQAQHSLSVERFADILTALKPKFIHHPQSKKLLKGILREAGCDPANKRGAKNIDSACTGTSLRDFLRGSDFFRVPEEIVALYSDGTESQGELVYRGAPAGETA